MKMLKNILFTIILMGAFSLITFAQSNDDKNKPPKEKPPVVSPKEKDKPKDPPPTPKPDQDKPKKPE